MSTTLAQNLLAATELLVGFVIVMFTLALLWGMTALIGKAVQRLERAAAAPKKAAPNTVPRSAAADAAAPASSADEELAVIAAAVALVLDAPHHLVSVRTVDSQWGQQGRREHHGLHRIR